MNKTYLQFLNNLESIASSAERKAIGTVRDAYAKFEAVTTRGGDRALSLDEFDHEAEDRVILHNAKMCAETYVANARSLFDVARSFRYGNMTPDRIPAQDIIDMVQRMMRETTEDEFLYRLDAVKNKFKNRLTEYYAGELDYSTNTARQRENSERQAEWRAEKEAGLHDYGTF